MVITRWDWPLLRAWFAEAGALAMTWYKHTRAQYKADRSLVTEADLAVEALAAGAFDHPAQGSYLIGEETLASRDEAYLQAAWAHKAWVVDPIDGTAPFCRGLPTWGISVGLLEAGRLTEGAVYLPVLDELYFTRDGHAFVLDQGIEKPLVNKAGDAAAEPGHMAALSQEAVRRGGWTAPYYVQLTGSTVFSLTQLAAGRYCGHITQCRLWDFAGGLPLLWAQGFVTETWEGQTLSPELGPQLRLEPGDPRRWTSRDPWLLATNQATAGVLRQGFKPE